MIKRFYYRSEKNLILIGKGYDDILIINFEVI
jgi:hypothetical protein